MSHPFAPYQQLRDRSREIALLNHASELLHWDLETYMPPKGLASRGELLALLGGLAHRQFTAPEIGGWIKACEDHGFPASSNEACNLREWRRLHHRATQIPPEFVEEFERARTQGRAAWQEARQNADFSRFQPALRTLVELNRRKADHLGYTDSPYDALLDTFEPGATTTAIRQLFDRLTVDLAPILRAAAERSTEVPPNLLDDDYPIPAQEAFNLEIAQAIGFDLEAGRLDPAIHPFCCSVAPGDCRITTRCSPHLFTKSLFGLLHEAGHGLYEQGLVVEHFGTPLGSFASLGIHESQSRLWENHIGRSLAFWEHWHPVACKHFPSLRRLSPAQITAAVNRVAPSCIRVEADPITYDFHIVLRFELEVRLLEGDLDAEDLPAAWNEHFEKLLGLKIPNDLEGCLQDIHWSLGELGYFPTYTLGNLNAAQLMYRAEAEIPGLDDSLRNGQYAPLLSWLRDRIHRHGLRHEPQELMRHATGEPTSAQYHIDHLRQRYRLPNPTPRAATFSQAQSQVSPVAVDQPEHGTGRIHPSRK